MTAEEQKRYINYLAERVREADLGLRARDLVIQDFLDKQKEYDEQQKECNKRLAKLDEMFSRIGSLEKSLREKERELNSAKREVAALKAKLKFADKNRFGDKRQGGKKKDRDPEESDRCKDKDDFDGTGTSLPENAIAKKQQDPSREDEAPKKKERDLSNRPASYDTMAVEGNVKEYKSDTSKVPGRIIEKKSVSVFRLDMSLVEERFELVHYVEPGRKPKWGYFPKNGNPETVTKFNGTKATPEFLQAFAYEVYVKNVTFGLLHRWISDMGMTVSAHTVIFFYDNGSRGRNVLTGFIGDAELKSIMSDGYNAYTFIGNELKTAETPNFSKTVHQVCLAHVRAKFVKAFQQAGDKNAEIFIKLIECLYLLEQRYDKEGITPRERTKRRQGLETKEILINLRQRLCLEKAKDPETVTPYLLAALNYLDTFWENIFAFAKDGNYPIDNNAAERAVRPLTTQRNSMLHFGSDDGAKMAATYHSIISTVKLQGRSAWEYLGKFFVKIFNGCRDYLMLQPDKIDLATCQ